MIATYRRIKQQRTAGKIDGGFTLIELLIVIVVLGILAAIVVFSLGTITQKSAVAACEADAQQLNTGIAAYVAGGTTGTYPAATTYTGLATFLSPTYLQTMPSATNPHYTFTYTTDATDGFILSVVGTSTQVVSTGNGLGSPLGAVGACKAAGVS